jgi:hypothetical protein
MRIQKGQLCDSCRKIHAIMSDGKPNKDSIEDILDSGAYKTMRYIFFNEAILTYLESDGGCSACINLFKRATSSV